MELIILAAGKSKRIFNSIKKNKCLIEINKKSLIEKIIMDSKNYFKKINIITGFKSHLIKKKIENYSKINIIHNKDYYKTEMLHSIIVGLKKINKDVVISYSDILISKKIWKIFSKLKKDEIMIPINTDWKKIWNLRGTSIYEDAESLSINKNNYLNEIGSKIHKNIIVDGQFMGLIFIPKNLIKKIIHLYNKNKLKKMQTTQFLNLLLSKKFKIKCKKTNLFWYEIDDISDLKNLNKIKNKID